MALSLSRLRRDAFRKEDGVIRTDERWITKWSKRRILVYGDEGGIRYFTFDDCPEILCEFDLGDTTSKWEDFCERERL